MRSTLAFFALAVSAVTAQTAVQTYKSSLDMTIDPGTVDFGTRAGWCNAQQDTCDTLCKDDTKDNDCTAETLKWECACTSNSSTPGLQYYTQTMPTFICQELFAQCISQNAGSQSGQRDCKQKIQALCATRSPPKNTASDDDDDDDATTTLSTATRSATQSAASASATEESVTSTSSDGLAAPTMAPAGKGAAAAVALGMLAYLL
ncbi:hypothetical protein MRS44_001160 [Fusarium solani]|uniref:DUF7707 domain-containing protein n=1 Tax=Fusarium solani TaxID=169388 RepID=A0A9P9RDE8_FUSSL|nr:uncharacterized protein B0J15DRAFT_129866 [Fusarium solani]KAH7274448.1 hypothetical protein B0J15DRAFT_129866 [Fusarium solani]KAJ3471061.1 hypothetical protein MRS44_001160 [Fusarium solani]KAJ4223985.1 hypothetical protein NW759_005655 [Fusarium solani]